MSKRELHRILFAGLALVVMLECMLAQKSNAPTVARLQPGMAWKVERLPESARISATIGTDHSLPEPESGKAELLESNRIGKDHRRQEVILPGQSREVHFITSEFLLTSQSDGTFKLQTTEEDEESSLPPLSPNQLREFAWIKGLTPVKTMIVDGFDCDVYAASIDGSPVQIDEGSETAIFYLAAIGRNDRFPRRLETPDQVLRLVPQAVVEAEELPESAQAVIDEYHEQLTKRIHRHALPR